MTHRFAARRARRPMRLRSGAGLAPLVAAMTLGALGAVSCGSGRPTATTPQFSSGVDGTIIAGADNELWVASPDDRSVAVIDSASLRTIRRLPVDATPGRLVHSGNAVIASLTDASSVAVLTQDAVSQNPASKDAGSTEDSWRTTIPIPCASGDGLAGWNRGGRSYIAVACPIDARVAVIDLSASRAIGWLAAPTIPTRAAVVDEALVVGATNGSLRRWALSDIETALTTSESAQQPVPASTDPVSLDHELRVTHRDETVWTMPGRTISQLSAVVNSPDGALATYQATDSERAADPTDPADNGSYASIIDGNARVEPAVSSWCPHLISDFSSKRASLSGPSAIAIDPDRDRLWVVGRSTGNLLVLDCGSDPTQAGRPPLLAEFELKVGAAGIVLSDDGDTAWIDSSFEHAVQQVRMPTAGQPSTGLLPVKQSARELGLMRLTPRAETGRRLFTDATDPHLTPTRVVSCATCHPGGGEDSLSWRIATRDIATKYRRTPPLWGLGDFAPLHWDGQFETLDRLTSETIRELLAGDGLLIDRAAIGEWLDGLAPPPPRWNADAASVTRGRQLFESTTTTCSSCHSGANRSDGLRHAVLGPSQEQNGDLEQARTPRLIGLAGRASYLHDGRATSLREILTDNPGDRHGRTSQLSPEQVTDLVSYLDSL